MDEHQAPRQPSAPITIESAGGAVIHGNVDTYGGDFVGRDKNIYIGSLKLPKWLIPVGVVCLVSVLAGLGLLVYQSLPPSIMPDGSFNIAVAELNAFNLAGKPLRTEEARERAVSIANFVNEQADVLTQIIKEKVVVWGPSHRIAPVAIGEEAARTQALHADVLVYGDLRQLGDNQWELQPKFFLSDQAIIQAQELAGEHALGSKLAYASDKQGARGEINAALQIRIEALSRLLYGLSLMTEYDPSGYQKAAAIFRDAAENSAWAKANDESGQEILYLFLGNAYLAEAQFTGSAPEVRAQLLAKSKAAFQTAVSLNSDYARSYNGLGSVNFQLARAKPDQDECEWNWMLMDEAKADFEQAINSPEAEKPLSGQVDYRAQFGLGRVHFWRGYCVDGAMHEWDAAQQYYHAMLDQFQDFSAPLPTLIDIAAFTHSDLGFMALLQSEQFAASDDAVQREKAGQLLQAAIHQYEQTFQLLSTSQTTDGLQHGVATMPYYLSALCIAEKGEDAERALQAFLTAAPTAESLRGQILSRMDQEMWEHCRQNKIS